MKPTTTRQTRLVRAYAAAAAAVLFLTAASLPLSAKTTTWTGTSPLNDLWSNAANWNNGVPASFDDVYFSAVAGTSTLDLPSLMLGKLDMTGYAGTLAASGASLQIAGDMATSGICYFDNADLTISGKLTVAGTMYGAHATILTEGNLVIAGELNCDHAAAINVQGTAGGSAGAVLYLGASSLTLQGNGAFADFSSVSWIEGGALLLNGSTGLQQIAFGTGTVSLHDVTVQRSNRSDVTAIESPAGLAFGGNVSVPQGTLQLVSNDVEFGGTLTARGEFVYSVTGGALRFAGGLPGKVDVTAGGAFRIAGVPSARVALRQDGVPGGSQWILGYDGTSTLAIDGVEVQDSDAQGPAPAIATKSADRGNNTNWSFAGPKTAVWIGGSPFGDSWSDPLNWDLGSPQSGDSVLFAGVGGTSTMDISGLTLTSMNSQAYLGDLTLLHSLDVNGDLLTGGRLLLGTNSLSILGDLVAGGYIDAAAATIEITGSLAVNGSLHCDPAGVVEVIGNVSGAGGALEMGSGLLLAGGNVHISSLAAASWGPGGRLVCAGASPVSEILIDPLKTILNDISIEHSSSTQRTRLSVSGGGPVEINGALAVACGTLEIAASTVIDGATSIQANGRLEIQSPVTFNNLVTVRGVFSCTASGAAARFAGGPAGVVDATNGGAFEVIGAPLALIRLEQDGAEGGDHWTLMHDETSAITVDHVEIQDSDAQGPGIAAATNSVDLGNNLNWYFGTVSEADSPPLRLALEAAPNPFNPTTTLRYEIPRAGNVSMRIYDAAGRLVRSLVAAHRAPGCYQASWDGRSDAGRSLGSGAYFCRVESNGEAKVQKLLLLR